MTGTRVIMRFTTAHLVAVDGAKALAANLSTALGFHLNNPGRWITPDLLPTNRHIPMAELFAEAKTDGPFYTGVQSIADEIRGDLLAIDSWFGPWLSVDNTDPENPIVTTLGTLVEMTARVRAKANYIQAVSGLITGQWANATVVPAPGFVWPHDPSVTLNSYQEVNGIRLWSE